VAGIGKLMKQAQQMQKKLSQLQSQLEQMEMEGSAGGGMVKAVVNGKRELISLSIKPDVLKEGDASLLEDLVLAAVRQASEKVEEASSDQLGSLTGGIDLSALGL